jgi:uncharacterized protein YprB with RNaseH-like and TPR domain
MNIFAMSRKEYRHREDYSCKHGHNGLPSGHPKCYDREFVVKERVGYFDLETSNLNANWGIILSYCILGDDGVLYRSLIKRDDIFNGSFDKNVCKQFCEDARNFDRLIGWYSERFDAPYARTRCLYHKLNFPVFKEIKHTDAWRVARNKLKLHSNRLGVVAPFFGIRAKDHPLNPNIWLQCLSGNQDALDFVMIHNEEDVRSLRDVWHKIEDSIKVDSKSL